VTFVQLIVLKSVLLNNGAAIGAHEATHEVVSQLARKRMEDEERECKLITNNQYRREATNALTCPDLEYGIGKRLLRICALAALVAKICRLSKMSSRGAF
jgi:hypothetical protein